MDVAKTATPALPALPEAPKTLPSAATLPASDPRWQALLDRVLDEIARQSGEPGSPAQERGPGRDELLLCLLERPGELGEEALRHLGPKSQRLREELLRLMGRGGENPRPERTNWPLLRWAWITAVVGVVSYPFSVGPVAFCMERLGLENAVNPTFKIVYFPLVWLYDTVPWVHAFYDWYLPFFELS